MDWAILKSNSIFRAPLLVSVCQSTIIKKMSKHRRIVLINFQLHNDWSFNKNILALLLSYFFPPCRGIISHAYHFSYFLRIMTPPLSTSLVFLSCALKTRLHYMVLVLICDWMCFPSLGTYNISVSPSYAFLKISL